MPACCTRARSSRATRSRSRRPSPTRSAAELSILHRLDRAEAKSTVAAWRAAARGGLRDRHRRGRRDRAWPSSPTIPGPALQPRLGFAQVPNLLSMATDFYDRHGTTGWSGSPTEPPWPDAERDLTIDVFAADAATTCRSWPPPGGVTIRLIGADDGPRSSTAITTRPSSTGVASDASEQPVAARSTRASPSIRTGFIFLAEIDGKPVGVRRSTLTAETGWLRGALVAPEARGRGIQRALIAARVRTGDRARLRPGRRVGRAGRGLGAPTSSGWACARSARATNYMYKPRPRGSMSGTDLLRRRANGPGRTSSRASRSTGPRSTTRSTPS